MVSPEDDTRVQIILEILQDNHGKLFQVRFSRMAFWALLMMSRVLDCTDFFYPGSPKQRNYFEEETLLKECRIRFFTPGSLTKQRIDVSKSINSTTKVKWTS